MSTPSQSGATPHAYGQGHHTRTRPPRRPTSFERHPLAWYFGLSCALTWLVWLPLMLDPRRALPTSPWWPLHFAGGLGPLAAGLVVAALSEGRGGVRELLGGFRPRSTQARWLAAAVAIPFALWAVAVALARAMFEAGMPSAALLAEWPKLPGVTAAGGWVLLFATFGVGEEGGWRGFALPRLQARHGPFVATLLLTLGWAAWHLPLFFHDPSFGAMNAAGVAGWSASLLAGAIVLTWMYNGSRGSTLATALFHTATNAVWMSRAVDEPVGSVLGACTMLLALAVAPWLWRDRPVIRGVARPRVERAGRARG